MIQINTKTEWEKVKQESKNNPVVLYIHSLTCSLSKEVIKSLSATSLGETAYIIPVQTSREISQTIETELKVKHESPQVIVMKDGKAVYDADHTRIDPEKILNKLKQ